MPETIEYEKNDARMEEIMFGKSSKMEIEIAIMYIRIEIARKLRILDIIWRWDNNSDRKKTKTTKRKWEKRIGEITTKSKKNNKK